MGSQASLSYCNNDKFKWVGGNNCMNNYWESVWAGEEFKDYY